MMISFLQNVDDRRAAKRFTAEAPTNFGSLTPEQRKERDEEHADWLREESRRERAAERWAE